MNGNDPRHRSAEDPVVLVVEDERDLADLYTHWLMPTYTVRTGYSGAEALEMLDPSVEVVLLDRRLPDLSGADVLGQIRERGLSCRVAMLTAVEPDVDILKFDIDEYLTKPVSRDELQTTVHRLLARKTLDHQLQRYLALAARRTALESTKSLTELEAHTEYTVLTDELANLRNHVNTQLVGLAATPSSSVLRYPPRRLVRDSIVIGLIGAILVGIHFGLPNADGHLLGLGSPDTNLLVSYLATFVHLDNSHLTHNVASYLVVASVAYLFTVRLRAARWFYLTVPGLLTVLPVVTSILSYGIFAALFPEWNPYFIGFSTVTAGFVGYAFLAYLALLRVVYDLRTTFIIGVFILLWVVDVLAWSHRPAFLFLPGLGTIIVFVYLVNHMVGSATDVTDTWPFVIHRLTSVGAATVFFTLFGMGLLPTLQLINQASIGIAGHVLGVLLGFGIALVTALLTNTFPIRERLERSGDPLLHA